MRVAEIVTDHRLAVTRDLLDLGYRWSDVGDSVGVEEFLAVVLAAPPNSSIRFYAVDQEWTQTDHLLANLGEQQAGAVNLAGRYPRPGLQQAAPSGHSGSPMDLIAMTVEEFEKKRAETREQVAKLAATEQKLGL